MRNSYKSERAKDLTQEIKTVFYESLAKGEILSVSALSKKLGINRATFYRHFYDMNDVLESIEDDIFKEVEATLGELDDKLTQEEFYIEVARLIEKNLGFLAYLMETGGITENRFFLRIISYSEKNYMHSFQKKHPKVPKEECENLFHYSLNGSISLISDWLKRGMKSPIDSFAKTMNRYNKGLTEAILAYYEED